MTEQLEQIEKEALSSLEQVEDEGALNQWKVTHLGRSSALMSTFDTLGTLPKEQRPLWGGALTWSNRRLKRLIQPEMKPCGRRLY